ncbi:BTAD domain-containing putative transcriptional regulator [Streptomyces sp. TG1A-8]|uniref:AfsR/SARP family transcriptional regulator n=1 Tax=Streptomyces sp. TG1A-8 TaxID=3051385 RepID=UPI00265B9EFD|nr:BTAD domain-containing putative transcriptional regulator [Streptomyces sp. TG1A-8]MDO0925062.1 BTAD domain-containing putative transcriptional regulator [Streptomyces sp. TG1A-8]
MSTRFAVLGPVRAWRGDTELTLGPPMRRGLLALLLTQAGHPVAVHEIVDALWGQNPPDTAVNVVQRHIGALRRLLEPGLLAGGESQYLIRGSGGYRLETDPDCLDLLRFRNLRQQAQQAAEAGRPTAATELLIEALALWRGPAAIGIAAEVRAHPVFTALDLEHLVVVKEAAELALKAGPCLGARVLVTLRQAAAQHPLDEALQARLILVLAATGHQAEALDVHRAVRTRLADELGVQPGPELQAAQQRVLAHAHASHASTRLGGAEPPVPDDGEAGPTGPAEPRSDTAATVRPAQLPVDLPAFTGRHSELARLRELLPAAGARGSTATIGVIGGMAGVGKTTLAVHWAHGVADRFPDGQLYVNLRGFHPTGSVMSPVEAIRTFLDAFGVPAHGIPAGLDAQAALYRSLLAERRVLIVLDNARDTEQVRPLLPGASGCLVIVTSRSQLYGLVAGEGAHPVTLDLLSEGEALQFLSRRLGPERVANEPGAAAQIVASCGRLPLALALVSARVVMNPTFPLASIASELGESGDSLDAFAVEAPAADARSAFSWSYQLLSPEAARVFRLLALHPGPDCSLAAVASLAGQRAGQVRPLLAELMHANLISETVPSRFSCHELLRTYGTELSRAQDTTQDLGTARRRLLDHYLHSAHAADSTLAPSRERIELPSPAAGVTAQRFTDQASAADWLETNGSVLLAAIEQDARHGSGEHSWQLASILESHLDRNGRWQEQEGAQATAMGAAQRLGDIRGQAHSHRALGFVSGRLERWDEAEAHLSRALELFGEIGDQASQGKTHRYLAFLANQRRLYDVALDHYAHASALYRAAARRSGEASTANELGWTYILMGEYDSALEQCGQALLVHQEIGDRNGEAAVWDSLGYAHHHLGNHGRALTCYQRALELYRTIRDRYLEADTLVHIGDTHRATPDDVRAALAWLEALGILEEIGHPYAVDVRHKLQGIAASAIGGQSFEG